MATVYDPIAKDESLNTTEATPRNIADVLAEGLKGIEDALPTYTEGDGIDISNNEISVDTTFTEASTRANIASGESFATILGKIKKFFTDLKTVAFTGAYSDLSGTENVAVKNENNNFSARQTIDEKNGTTSSMGTSVFAVGNSIARGNDGNSRGLIRIFSADSYNVDVRATELTGTRAIEIPDKNGTFALTSDVWGTGDEYSASKSYAVGDYCIYNNTLYRCVTACTAANWSVNSSCFTVDTVVNAINRNSITMFKVTTTATTPSATSYYLGSASLAVAGISVSSSVPSGYKCLALLPLDASSSSTTERGWVVPYSNVGAFLFGKASTAYTVNIMLLCTRAS